MTLRREHREREVRGVQKSYPVSQLRYRLKRKYNLPHEVVEELIKQHATAACPICLSGGRPMQLDHDHACCPGKESCGQCVRGYICNRCNHGLARFGDDADVLGRAIRYLAAPPLRQP